MPHLIGRDIVLREYRAEDLPATRAWVNDAGVTRFLSGTFLHPHTLPMTEGFYQRILSGGGEGFNFIIADKQDDSYIGQIDLVMRNKVSHTMELGIVIGNRAAWGKGYGTQAIGLLLRFAFEEVNLHRVELWVHDTNPRAIRCYEKCGFTHEGRRRQHIYQSGTHHDLLLMGILREEWLASQSNQ